ncbi:transposase [Chryseobacterium polytrichastri]|uniref:transposase n=1 Tax=Chryseobacterium polytrichastri TaxID=1302687 RepID=UPI0021CD6B65|nr:transposase [Chryseobacterium polytrichastri]
MPPYSPELNPCEQVWQYKKKRFKNKFFETIQDLKEWLHKTVNEMTPDIIKSITSNHRYLNAF